MACNAKSGTAMGPKTLDLESYDPVRNTDEARKLIGYALLALLILIVLMGFVALFLIEFQLHGIDRSVVAAIHSKDDAERMTALLKIATDESKANADRLAQFLNIVFGPVVTLLGSVTGFYFGTQSGKTANKDGE